MAKEKSFDLEQKTLNGEQRTKETNLQGFLNLGGCFASLFNRDTDIHDEFFFRMFSVIIMI